MRRLTQCLLVGQQFFNVHRSTMRLVVVTLALCCALVAASVNENTPSLGSDCIHTKGQQRKHHDQNKEKRFFFFFFFFFFFSTPTFTGDKGIYRCIPTGDLSQRSSGLHVVEYEDEVRISIGQSSSIPLNTSPQKKGTVLSGKTIFFKLDASSFDASAYPRGLSLYVHLIPKNAYQRSLEADQLFLATDETKKEAIVDRRYTHKGVYTVQMAPHEFGPEVYYVEYRNLLGRDVEFTVLFQLDEPQQKFLNSPVTVDGHEAEGDKLLYFYVDLAAARAEAKSQPIAPAFFEAHIVTGHSAARQRLRRRR
jgi:hypothetical protein